MPQNCPYCREAIAEIDLISCPTCHTPHHRDCWQENGGCTVFGCKSAPADEPKISLGSELAAPDVGAPGYLVARDGQQFGPYSLPQIHDLIRDRRVSTEDLAWTEGMPTWVPVSQIVGSGAPSPLGAMPPRLGGYRSRSMDFPRPDTNMAVAVVVTLFCCIPFGIVSIVFAAQVNSKYDAGDYEGSKRASDLARTWAIAALVAGLAVIVLSVIGNANK